MTKAVSVILADDHAMLRGSLSRALNSEPGLRVIASVGTADDAVCQSAALKPDVLLLDIDMPGMVCFDAAKRLQALSPDTRVIFLSAYFHDRYIDQALSVRAWGYVVKTESETLVAEVIRKVASGTPYFSPEIQRRLIFDGSRPRLASPSTSRASSLTGREFEVLRLIARGLSENGIAQAMHVSPNTVHNHTTSIKKKLDIQSRTELVRYAIREGIAES